MVRHRIIKRVASGYNIFSSKMLSSDVCKEMTSKSEKMSFVASKWQSLSEDEQNKWKTEAKKTHPGNQAMLTADERKKHIKKGIKNLEREFTYLESLGCEIAVLVIEPEAGEVNQYGTNGGVEFLSQHETIPLKFMQHFDCANAETSNYARKDVQDLFNKKYSEACGIPGSRVSYLKGNFNVTGLPADIPFRKPNSYGIDQVNTIMKNKENIVFHILPDPDSGSSTTTSNKDAAIHHILCKIVDVENISDIIAGRKVIEENELEVKELDLNEQEYHFLANDYTAYFTCDAWGSLKANYASCCNHEGYILPIYTTSENEPYWLFYYPGKITEIQKMQDREKVWGFWLDATDGKLSFELLLSKEQMTVDAISIISNPAQENSSRCPLFVKRKLQLENRAAVIIPESFHINVIACLKQHGFLM